MDPRRPGVRPGWARVAGDDDLSTGRGVARGGLRLCGLRGSFADERFAIANPLHPRAAASGDRCWCSARISQAVAGRPRRAQDRRARPRRSPAHGRRSRRARTSPPQVVTPSLKSVDARAGVPTRRSRAGKRSLNEAEEQWRGPARRQCQDVAPFESGMSAPGAAIPASPASSTATPSASPTSRRVTGGGGRVTPSGESARRRYKTWSGRGHWLDRMSRLFDRTLATSH